jgi:undecaprenyl-diphosphatase
MNYWLDLDIAVFRWLNSWDGISTFWDWAIIFCTTYLWYVVVLAVAGFGIVGFLPRFKNVRARNLRLAIHAAVAAVVSRFIITELIRLFYSRPRPFEALPDVIQLVDHTGGGSFPSGHAALAFSVAAAVSFYYPKTSILFFLAAFSIGIGRIAAGLHWPSDILGGAIVGIGTAYLWHKTLKTIY